jgi:hypothetical protein
MSRKQVLYGFQIYNAVDLSSSQTSAEVEVGQADYGSIFVSWSGSSVSGSLQVMAKNGVNGTYRALDFGASIPMSTNSGNHDLILNEMPFTHLKLVYTRSAGTGSMTASITTKSKGS